MNSFFVKGEPKPQPRMKAFNRGKHAGVYDPGTAQGWKDAIWAQAGQHCPESPLEGPIRVDIDFFLKRPLRLCRKKDPEAPVWCAAGKRNDRDNLDKVVLDVLTQLGFWQDDGQVCDGRIRKFYHAKGGIPGARIWVTRAAVNGKVNGRPDDVEGEQNE